MKEDEDAAENSALDGSEDSDAAEDKINGESQTIESGTSSSLVIKDVDAKKDESEMTSLVIVRGLPIAPSSEDSTLAHQIDPDDPKHEVKFASRFTAIAYPREKDESHILKPLSDEMLSAWRKYLQLDNLIVLNESFTMLPKEYVSQFTQTFFKALTKVSDRRLMEILNMRIDHEDISLAFYCTSEELLTNPRGTEDEL